MVVSPDELNEHLRTVILALDQLRTVDVERLVETLGHLDRPALVAVLEGLQDMFAE